MVKKKVRSIGRERNVDGREQNRREISRVRVKDVKVPISSSAKQKNIGGGRTIYCGGVHVRKLHWKCRHHMSL